MSASADDATQLALYLDTRSVHLDHAEVAGQSVNSADKRLRSDSWRWGFTFVGPPIEGVYVDLTVSGNGPVRMRVVAETPGIPAAAMDVPMPATVVGAVSPAVYTLAARTATF